MTQPTGTAGTWRVTGQSQTTDLDSAGKFVDGMTVSFTTGYGHQGSVFVPLSSYTREVVANAIAARAAIMDDIGQLSTDTAS